MKKILGVIFIVSAVSMALTIYNEGLDQAYGGVFAGLAPDSSDKVEAALDKKVGRLAKQASGSFSGPAQTNYKKLVDRVRTKTDEAMRKSERRAAGMSD
jgi:hypothetical protein